MTRICSPILVKFDDIVKQALRGADRALPLVDKVYVAFMSYGTPAILVMPVIYATDNPIDDFVYHSYIIRLNTLYLKLDPSTLVNWTAFTYPEGLRAYIITYTDDGVLASIIEE